jgi:hypothetical protein
MADDIKEFSKEEASSFLFNGSPAQSPMLPVQQAPSAPAAAPSLAMPSKSRPSAGIPDPTQLVETVSKANKKLKEETAPPEPPSAISGLVDQITSNWKPIAATAAATYAATKAAPIIGNAIGSAYEKIKNRNAGAPVETTRIEPVFATPDEMRQAEALTQKPAPTMTPLENLQKRAEDLRAAVQGKAPAVPPQFNPNPVAPAGNIPPAPVPTYGPNSSITTKVSDTISDLIDDVDASKAGQLAGPKVESFARDANGNIMWPEKMSPAGRAGAEAFMQQYPNHAAELAKEGRFGILGAGSGDNNLFNAYGADLRKKLLDEVNQGQLVGEYNNYLKKVNPTIKGLSPESVLGKELADMRINQPKSANRGSLGLAGAVTPETMVQGPAASKALKNAGKAFLGLAIADAANAATEGNTAPAKEVGFDLATGALLAKILGGPASIAGALGLGSAGLNKGEEQELAYRNKVGAGRGIAPPSAYMR